MANIKFPTKKFVKDFGKLDEKLQNKIAMFGTTLEFFDEKEMEIEINPDRPDLLSYQGFKRAFQSFLEKETGLKEYKINSPQKNYSVKIDSSVKDVRPYTACAIVKGLKFDDSNIKELIDIQEKIHTTVGRRRKKLAIGIYPLEKISLPITFKAMEPDKIKFQPLEGQREMSGLEILQRHPAGREYSHLLAGKSKFPIFVDNNKNVLSMPPIINSHMTGKVSSETKDVFLECSGFDFKTLEKVLNILVTTLADMGGKIYQMNLKYPSSISKKKKTPSLEPLENKISLKNTNKLLGLNLDEKQLKKLLGKMGHDYNKGDVKSPSWRSDLLHEVDLIEDVAIAYGYENFSPEIPKISTIGEEDSKETTKRKISEIVSGLGFIEVSNYHLTKKHDQYDKMGINEKNSKSNNLLQVDESKTEYNTLRNNLSHFIIKNFAENIDSEFPQKIFETGRIFDYQGITKNLEEKDSFSAAITPGNLTDVKQVLNYLSEMIGQDMIYKEPKDESNIPEYLINARTAEIYLRDKFLGYIGEVHPKILKNWKIKNPISIFEISLEEIYKEIN